ncbi:uncharacterized protein LOC107361184 isoform X1 [Tetranychus urticae]|uniref:F-box domain-containing protein n=1 Tax=Tetranychus urticae TaxID=32264 RepID=T1JT71_TETUR|nr:uncharacterized protein LOC107361184 isoform X1 [Tetranychus urticae]
MSIEILDDSCLFRIFREIKDKQTLIICSQVNRRWHSLIFPDTTPKKRFNSGKIRKGLKSDVPIQTIALDGWEIVSAPYDSQFQPDFFTKHGRKMKQLYIADMSLDDFKKYVKYLPRLERLHLSSYYGGSKPSAYYDGPKLERLEILEICTRPKNLEPYRGLSLMDRCPYLKSAFHKINGEDFFVDTQVKNYHLEDLVIENIYNTGLVVNWPTLKKILRKCPNLKHLAIRHLCDTDIEDENIPEMLELLPKVVLIDLRVSPGVTYISAEYVDEYCKLHNRSISFYYAREHERDIRVDWPQLSNRKFNKLQCPGYSFMKHCFLKPFNELPRVMDPIFLLPLLEDDIRNNKSKPDVQEEDLDPDTEDSLDLGIIFD